MDHVTLDVAPFTLKSIIGPNGAGKTTFFNLLSGQYRPSEGRILFKGRDITRRGAAARTRLGIGRSFQLTNIFPTLTVLENVRLAVQAHRGLGFTAWRDYRSFPDLEDAAYRLLETVLLATKWAAPAGALAHGEKRKLELGILLALEPEVLLLDEPTAGMSLEEVPAIIGLIEAIRARRDRTILLVEHKIDMVMALSDSIAVLKDGRLIADGPPAEVSASAEVQAAYFGSPRMPDLLELEDVHTDIGQHHILQGVSLRVRPDAVTVLLGRNGAGKTTTMRTIMGVLRPRRGAVRFDGRPIHALAPHAIARLGIGYVPEGQGIFATLTVDENLRVAMLAETAESRDRLRRALVLFPDLERFRHARAGTLSGGQKQMLAIARAFVNPTRLLLIDEPSKGLAPIVIEHLVGALAAMKEHATVVLVEQNFAMASRLGDDCYVMDDGRTVHAGPMAALAADQALKRRYLGV